MEGYAYSYPDSGHSSPRSREIDFENPPTSWEDQPPPSNHKVKLMVSYGGKIQPRTHNNQLSYVGGDTKILFVDRSIKFNSLLNKLLSLLNEDTNNSPPLSLSSFKYQLPGEDLDALISVTNDDDLDHLMHEYDRLHRSSSKPARLRLFAFPVQHPGFGSQDEIPPPPVANNDMDFFFGLENKGPGPGPGLGPVNHHLDRVVMPDPLAEPRIQELNRLQISEPPQPPPVIYPPKSEDSFSGGFGGEVYQKQPPPPTIPASVQVPVSYWPPGMTVEHQHQHQQQPMHPPPQQQHQQHQPPPPPPQSQPVYMIHAPPPQTNIYHHAPQMVRPVSSQPPPPQGYYQVQRMPSDQPVYREQPLYSVAPPQPPMSTPPQPARGKVGGFSEGVGVPVRPPILENSGAYQVAYDSATGRQVYYAAPGTGGVGQGIGVVSTPFQGQAVSGDVIRPPSGEGKVVYKVSPSATV